MSAITELAWPDIDSSLLREGRPTLPDFPLQSLSPSWRAWADETARAVGAPVDYVVQALLTSVAGICGACVVARPSEAWDEPLILWLALVGGPAHGKTPALDALRRTVARLAAALAPLDWAANTAPAALPPRVFSGDTPSAACRLWDYFREHARAVLARGALSDGEPVMRRVLGWIRPQARPDQPGGRAPRRAQALNAEQSLKVIERLDPRRLPARGCLRSEGRRPAAAALRPQPGPDWRCTGGNCENCANTSLRFCGAPLE